MTAVFTDPEMLDALEHVYGPALPVVIAYTASLDAGAIDEPPAPPAELEPWR